MMFGVIAGGLGIVAAIVAMAWYGGTMASRIEYQGKQIDALEFRTKVLENKVSRTGS